MPGNTVTLPTISLEPALSRRVARQSVAAACIVFATACSSVPYKAYDSLELPSSEIVTVKNSSRFAFWSFTDIYSVDGIRVKQAANAIAVLPGEHWYQVVVTRRSKPAMFFLQDGFYQEAVCGFMLQAAPGTVHTLGIVDNSGLASTNEHKVYTASMGIEEAVAAGAPVARQIPAECASLDLIERGWLQRLEPTVSSGFLCRDRTDCHFEGTACTKEAGFSYGVCSKP